MFTKLGFIAGLLYWIALNCTRVSTTCTLHWLEVNPVHAVGQILDKCVHFTDWSSAVTCPCLRG